MGAIVGGFASGGSSSNARKLHLKAVLQIEAKAQFKKTRGPIIIFSDEDFGPTILGHDNPLVISVIIGNADV